MTNFFKITDYALVERRPGYDKLNNPSLLNVAELTPLGATWKCNGLTVSVHNADGVGAEPLRDLSGVAVVEAPYNEFKNRAYIVNSDGSERAAIGPIAGFGRVFFYDVFYFGSILVFVAATSNGDIKIQVNDVDGGVLSVSEFR
jgi:hypothetical protein